MSTPFFSVVVPTHGRVEQLDRCLRALGAQTHDSFEVIVAHPDDDDASAEVVAHHPQAVRVTVSERSQVAGLKAGFEAARGDIVCTIDDDAEAAPDWLARMAAHFADTTVGAVGGRDAQPRTPAVDGATVGRITYWGKLIGNHHVGSGPGRRVDVLKGVNMAVRREFLAIPVSLRGGATKDHYEVAMSLWVAREGSSLVYDPRVLVDHTPAARVDGSERSPGDRFLARASADNLVYSIASLRPDLVWRRALFGVLVGDRGCPGLLRGMVGLMQGDRATWGRTAPSVRGQVEALLRVARGRPMRMQRIAEGTTIVPVSPSRRRTGRSQASPDAGGRR